MTPIERVRNARNILEEKRENLGNAVGEVGRLEFVIRYAVKHPGTPISQYVEKYLEKIDKYIEDEGENADQNDVAKMADNMLNGFNEMLLEQGDLSIAEDNRLMGKGETFTPTQAPSEEGGSGAMAA